MTHTLLNGWFCKCLSPTSLNFPIFKSEPLLFSLIGLKTTLSNSTVSAIQCISLFKFNVKDGEQSCLSMGNLAYYFLDKLITYTESSHVLLKQPPLPVPSWNSNGAVLPKSIQLLIANSKLQKEFSYMKYFLIPY